MCESVPFSGTSGAGCKGDALMNVRAGLSDGYRADKGIDKNRNIYYCINIIIQ